VSNVFGTVNPIGEMIEKAHRVGAKVLVDGAQGAVHGTVDVGDLGCDFYTLSGHKLYGPTGIGVLWARAELLEEMPPWHGGGEMIREVSFDGTTYADPPARFEAGTPNISGAVGLAAAMDWMEGWGREEMARHESDLLEYGVERLAEIDGLRFVGTAPDRAAILSFVVDGCHAQDVGTLLDRHGVAVRTGHHCAQPALKALGLTSTVRASLAAYSSRGDLDRLADALERSLAMLR
jgi:cysteine desulfurase/selenocysteine lyase